MATGFTLTLNSNYLPTIPLGITGTAYAATGGYVNGVYTGGIGFTGSPTGGSWYVWTVNANTINPAGPTGYTGAPGTLVIAGNMRVLGTLTASNPLTNNVAQLDLLAPGIGPGTGVTGTSGDKLLFVTGTTGTYPVSIGNSGTTLYQSVPYGGALASYVGGTGASLINTSTIAIGVGAGGFGPTGSVAIGTNAGTAPSTISASGAYDQIAVGAYAAYQNQSALAIAIGYAAAGYTGITGATGVTGTIGGQGVASIAIGAQAGYENDPQFGAPIYSQAAFNSGAPLGYPAVSQLGAASNILIPSFGTNAYYLSQNGGVSFSYLYGSTGATSGATGSFSSAIIGATGGAATPFMMLGTTGSYPAYATTLTGALANVTSGGATGGTYMTSSSTLSTIMYTNNAGVVYWAYNATPNATAPVFTTLTSANFVGGVVPAGCTLCAISPTVTVSAGYGLLATQSTVYYSSTMYATAVGSVSFSTLPGLPVCTAPTVWSAFAMSSTGLYMLAVTSAGNMYLSSNGTAGAANTTFSILGTNTTVSAGAGNAVLAAAMSYTGQLMAVASPTAVLVSYNYGLTWSTSVAPAAVFAPATQPPVPFVITGMSLSGDGVRLVVVGAAASIGSVASLNSSMMVYYTLQTSNYTVAIGNQAGQINQGAQSIAVGAQAGQVAQGANAIAIGVGAGQTNQGQQSVALGAGAGAFTDAFQYTAPSANTMSVSGFGIATLSAYISVGNQVGSAMSYNGQYQIVSGAGNGYYYLSSNYGVNFNIYTMTANYINYFAACDQTGQYMIIGNFNGTYFTPYYSTNYGVTFSSMPSYPATTFTTAPTICASSSMNTIFTASYSATSIIWYTYNATPSVIPTYTQLSTGGANQLPNGYCLTSNISGNGTSLIVSMSTATLSSSALVAGASTLYYSATTGTVSTTNYGSIAFNTIPTTTGLPASLANCYWSYMALSQTGQYILVVGGILRSSGTGTGMGVYLCRNGATGTTPTAYTSLVFTQIPTASLPATYHYTTCVMSSSGSTMVVFGTPAPYTAAAIVTGFVSYDYGNTWTTAANGLTTSNVISISVNPQVLNMFNTTISGDGTRLLVPSGGLGILNWTTTNPLTIPAYAPIVSPNGQNVMVFGQGSTVYYLSCNGGTTTTSITPVSTVASLSVGIGSTYNPTTGSYYYLLLPYSAGNASLYIGGSAYYVTVNSAGVQTAASIVSSLQPITVSNYQFTSVAANLTLNHVLIANGNNTGNSGNVWWAYNAAPTAAPSFVALSATNGAIFSATNNYAQLVMSTIVTLGAGTALITYNNGSNVSQVWYSANAHTTVATGPSFSALGAANGLPALTTPASVYFSSCAISGAGTVMVVGVYGGGVYLATPAVGASPLFLLTVLPTSTWTYATMSTSGQFICMANANAATSAVLSLTTATLVVSYTSGVTWFPLALPIGYANALGNHPVMSADGSRVVLAATTGVYVYTMVSFVSQNTVAVGAAAGAMDQGVNAVAIGASAGQSFQGSGAVALGVSAGASAQGANAVAISCGVTGASAGAFGQGASAIAIGYNTAIGTYGITGLTGFTGPAPYVQGASAIAIGYGVSAVAQGAGAMAIGYQAGGTNQGAGAIAIGTQSAGGTGYVSAGVGVTGTTLNYLQYIQGFTGATGTMSSLSYAPNIAGVTGGQGANSIAIGVGAGYQNDTSTILPAAYKVTALTSSVAPWNCAISYTGQYMFYIYVFGTTTYVSNNYGLSFVGVTTLATNHISMSSSGQYIFIGAGSTANFIWSTNYGQTFNAINPGFTVTQCIYPSGNGQYLWFLGSQQYGAATIYYSTSGTSSVPVITACSGLFGLPSGTTAFPHAKVGVSYTGQYCVFPLYTAIGGNYYVYYTSTGTATTPSFQAIPTTAGIPLNVGWNGAAISGNGQYILLIQNVEPSNVYLCSNGTAGVNALFFTPLSLPVTNTVAGWAGCTISYTGQYMFLSQGSSTGGTFVSYNYGINWQVLLSSVSINSYGNIAVSGNGAYAIITTYYGTTFYVFTLSTVSSSANNVAIGTSAGAVNQSGAAVAIGAGAGLTNQPNSAVAIGVGAGAENDTMIYNGALAIPISNAAATYGYTAAHASANGQVVLFTASIFGYYSYSLNGGAIFTNTANTNPSFQSLLSSNGQYAIIFGYGNYGYYTSTMNTTPSFTAFSASNGLISSYYYFGCNSASFQYVLLLVYNGAAIYWSSNGNNGTAANVIFTSLTQTANGIPNPNPNNLFQNINMNMAPNSPIDGQYCIYSVNTSATTSYLYFSNNTNASSASAIRFGQIQTSTGIPVLTPILYTGWSGNAISSNGNYILVTHNINYEGSVYLSTNGTSAIISGPVNAGLVTGLTFSPITSLPFANWEGAAMSYSGQYMAVCCQGNTSTIVTIYVSYNYGSTWSPISFISQVNTFYWGNSLTISGDGSRMIVMTSASGLYSNAFSGYIWMLSANTTANTVAIGYQAGQYNQAPNTISIGFQAGQTLQGFGGAAGTAAFFSQTQSISGAIAIGFQAGRYGQGANAIALGFQAGVQYFNNLQPAGSFTISINSVRPSTFGQTSALQLTVNTTTGEITSNAASKTFVIDHPIDPERYLVHACVEGPESGVYYRGLVAGSRSRATALREASEEASGEALGEVGEVGGVAADGVEAFVITLPDYAKHIATDFSVEITGITHDPEDINTGNYVATPVVDGVFTVYGPAGYDFHWMVHGRRLSIDVEPKREDVELRGTEPYLYVVPRNRA